MLGEKEKNAFYHVLQFHALATFRMSEALRKSGDLSLPEYDALLTLEVAGKPLRMSELAELVVYSRSGLTRLIDRLESRGYVERHLCPTDRRGMFCHITEKGMQVRTAAGPAVLKEVGEIFDGSVEASAISAMDDTVVKLLARAGGRARDIV